jgi:hypothetical protein
VSLGTLGSISFKKEDFAGLREEINAKILPFANDIENGRYDAVIPYYEFVSPIGLTDEQWKKRFDGDEPPESPVWLKPIITP